MSVLLRAGEHPDKKNKGQERCRRRVHHSCPDLYYGKIKKFLIDFI